MTVRSYITGRRHGTDLFKRHAELLTQDPFVITTPIPVPLSKLKLGIPARGNAG